MKQILMLTLLPLHHFTNGNREAKTAGNQTMYNTLKGYSHNGFKVDVLSYCDSPTKRYQPFPNITITRSWYVRVFQTIRKIKRKILSTTEQTPSSPSGVIRRNFSLHSRVAPHTIICLGGLLHALIHRPDVVYGYEIHTTRAARWIANIIRKPLVTRFQGTELSFFLNDEDTFWKAHNYIEGTRVPADLVIMTNDGTEGKMILDKLKVDSDKVRFWINGLHDKEAYLNYARDAQFRAKMKLPQESFVLCVANRFIDWKRIDRIIRVTKRLRDKGHDVYLLAIGSGPEEFNLRSLVTDLGIEEYVRFTGALEHEQVIYYLANADLCITLNEGGNLGNSILEAMALGTPVCTIENHSIQELLTDGENAILTQTPEIEDIADRIIDVIKNRSLYEKLSMNARNTARDKIKSWPERMEIEAHEVGKLIHD